MGPLTALLAHAVLLLCSVKNIMGPGRRGSDRRSLKVSEARPLIEEAETERLVSSDSVRMRTALMQKFAQNNGLEAVTSNTICLGIYSRQRQIGCLPKLRQSSCRGTNLAHILFSLWALRLGDRECGWMSPVTWSPRAQLIAYLQVTHKAVQPAGKHTTLPLMQSCMHVCRSHAVYQAEVCFLAAIVLAQRGVAPCKQLLCLPADSARGRAGSRAGWHCIHRRDRQDSGGP